MTPADHARDQLRILEELLELTPLPHALRPDVAALQQTLDQRRELIGKLDVPAPNAGDDPDLVLMAARAQQLVAEIVRRDEAINAMLREAKASVQQQLSRVGRNTGGALPVEAGSWIA